MGSFQYRRDGVTAKRRGAPVGSEAEHTDSGVHGASQSRPALDIDERPTGGDHGRHSPIGGGIEQGRDPRVANVGIDQDDRGPAGGEALGHGQGQGGRARAAHGARDDNGQGLVDGSERLGPHTQLIDRRHSRFGQGLEGSEGVASQGAVVRDLRDDRGSEQLTGRELIEHLGREPSPHQSDDHAEHDPAQQAASQQEVAPARVRLEGNRGIGDDLGVDPKPGLGLELVERGL